ncbi:hypothetical protein BDZ94DRAFT_1323298 [Collybia nuda]|uniref:Microbial-type PARG catalytic domain-containing protein n=1 Tax=Collybia nuda TaxID=64659 RepID=A0A9P5Y1E8_9AGAR|nr:hypothetical protein BDZ94DRAFT_1323298 [Collybia nuda]
MADTTPIRPSLRQIGDDTIVRSSSIILEHAAEGASLESTFIKEGSLPALDSSLCPGFQSSEVKVVNADSFTVARDIIREYPSAHGKVSVLNLASDEEPAGGWKYVRSKTQEEALCYSSTLFCTLKSSYYPWPNLGPGSVSGIYSPGVVIFKNDLDHDCVDLDPMDRKVVSVLTVAAPRGPDLTSDESSFKNSSDLDNLRGKIKLVYRMAAYHGQQYLVLGAMGCGAYACPPKLVAEEMKTALLDPEFGGWFRKVVFAVYSNRKNGPGNFDVFQSVFNGALEIEESPTVRTGTAVVYKLD